MAGVRNEDGKDGIGLVYLSGVEEIRRDENEEECDHESLFPPAIVAE